MLYTKLTKLAFLYCLHLKILKRKLDVVISHINLISKHHDKCKFALKVIQLVIITKNAKKIRLIRCVKIAFSER